MKKTILRWVAVGMILSLAEGVVAAAEEKGGSLEKVIQEATEVRPSPQQMEWQKLEYIAFVHFTVNTFTDKEWGEGTEDPKVFLPTELDCRQWARVCKEAGMKMMILTAKHHDGFCLWPSRFTEHSVKNSLWREGKGDVVREAAEACREYGLKFGFYLSPWDRHEKSYGDSPRYNEYFKNQLGELLSNYGEITEVWFDGACGEGPNGKKQEYDWPGYYEVVRRLQPKAVIAICGPDVRWVGNESGVARETEWSVQPAELTAEAAGKLRWHPAECDVSIRPGWFYHTSEDDKVKTVEQLLEIYYQSVGRNSVLLLNVPPDRRGLFYEVDVERLLGLRKALDTIFKTDLALKAAAKASNVWEDELLCGPANTVDGDPESFWATDDGVSEAWIEYDLGEPKKFNLAVLQENIVLGQRIEEFVVEWWDGKEWKEGSRGTTVGYKRILPMTAVEAQKVRVRILRSRVSATLSSFSLFYASIAGR